MIVAAARRCCCSAWLHAYDVDTETTAARAPSTCSLESVYDTYDSGVSTGAAAATAAPPSYCSLQVRVWPQPSPATAPLPPLLRNYITDRSHRVSQDYLRMLVFEVPIPIRRAGVAVQLFLPGIEPVVEAAAGSSSGGTQTLYMPPPDAMPALQFNAKAVLAAFKPEQILRAVAALALERRVVVVGACGVTLRVYRMSAASVTRTRAS